MRFYQMRRGLKRKPKARSKANALSSRFSILIAEIRQINPELLKAPIVEMLYLKAKAGLLKPSDLKKLESFVKRIRRK